MMTIKESRDILQAHVKWISGKEGAEKIDVNLLIQAMIKAIEAINGFIVLNELEQSLNKHFNDQK